MKVEVSNRCNPVRINDIPNGKMFMFVASSGNVYMMTTHINKANGKAYVNVNNGDVFFSPLDSLSTCIPVKQVEPLKVELE